ncbi:hypothetical protein P692DRAFT_201577350 [Suillus brevipes Sb2]|nr:hypothetical protein P692DRAFT_201577350 [Suillus brevipes Sb2]
MLQIGVHKFGSYSLSLPPQSGSHAAAGRHRVQTFTNVAMPNVPCAIKFKTRVPEVGLRRMMQNVPEVG